MDVCIYHNSRCSKSRATLELLLQRGLKPTIIPYLEQPPDTARLRQILSMLGKKPRELMRRTDKLYQELNIDNPDLSTDELLTLMHQHPQLIERPIVVAANQARIGRPPESVLEIL